MKFPSDEEFIDCLGLHPVETDADMAYAKFSTMDSEGVIADFSYSAVSQSFQVVISCVGREVALLSSECVESIDVFESAGESGVRVACKIGGIDTEISLTTSPRIRCKWWLLKGL